MRRQLLLLLFLTFVTPFQASARGATQGDDWAHAIFHQLLADQKEIWTAPVRKETWQRKTPFVMAFAGGVSFALDDEPSRRLRESPDFSCFNDILASNASGAVLTVFPVAVLATGKLIDRPGMADYGIKATRAAIAGISVAVVLKAVTQRPRPHSGKVYGFWEGGNSFPSGHSAVAWAIAGATSRHFEDHRWVPFVAYPIAGIIAFSRVTSGNHFASDAVVGSMLGWAVGYYGIR